MKKTWILLLVLALLIPSLALASSNEATFQRVDPGAAPADGPTPEPTAVPTPLPPPGVATPNPEAAMLLGPTRTPYNWVQSADVGFDANVLTTDERNDIIHQLEIINMRIALSKYQVVEGLATSRENPCYVGQRAVFMQQNGSDPEFRINMAIADVQRGAEGAAAVLEMNPYNDSPPPGKEYVVATFDVSVNSEEPNMMMSFSMFEFEVVNSAGVGLPYAMVTDDMSNLSLFSGGADQVRVTALVDEGTNVLLRYRQRVWFSTMTLEGE